MVSVVLTACPLSASETSMSVPREGIISVRPAMRINDVMQGKEEDDLMVNMKSMLFG